MAEWRHITSPLSCAISKVRNKLLGSVVNGCAATWGRVGVLWSRLCSSQPRRERFDNADLFGLEICGNDSSSADGTDKRIGIAECFSAWQDSIVQNPLWPAACTNFEISGGRRPCYTRLRRTAIMRIAQYVFSHT